MRSSRGTLRMLVWIGGTVSGVALVFAVLASWLLYNYTIDLLTENLRERLLSISKTQAANIDAQTLAALEVEADWQKPEWAEVVTKLKKAKDTNDSIVFMYLFRKTKDDPTQMEFVADAESLYPYANLDDDPSNDVDANGDGVIEPEGADKLQWPGQPYPEAVDIPEAYEAYRGPLTVRDLYEDSYGQVLTGYAPITDERGEAVAILATDIKADDFFTVTRQTLYPFLLFIAFLVLTIVFLATTLIYIWNRRAEALARLSAELETTNERLKELDHLKSEFVSIASHQLRSPLTAIKGYASLLLEGSFGTTAAGVKEAVQKIFDSSVLMVSSVEDFLNVSRIEQGRMTYKMTDFDVSGLAKTVVEELLPVAQKKKLSLSFSSVGECRVHADKGKIKQVIENLVDNAIKYTRHGSVRVSVTKDMRARTVHLAVSDTGVGIPAEARGQLFGKFSRAKNANSANVSGTGLGLYVAKQLVEAHKGKIWVESTGEGKGSTFFIELPALG